MIKTVRPNPRLCSFGPRPIYLRDARAARRHARRPTATFLSADLARDQARVCFWPSDGDPTAVRADRQIKNPGRSLGGQTLVHFPPRSCRSLPSSPVALLSVLGGARVSARRRRPATATETMTQRAASSAPLCFLPFCPPQPARRRSQDRWWRRPRWPSCRRMRPPEGGRTAVKRLS